MIESRLESTVVEHQHRKFGDDSEAVFTLLSGTIDPHGWTHVHTHRKFGGPTVSYTQKQ